MSDQSEQRRKILHNRLETLHGLYMKAPIGSAVEQRWGRLIQKTETALDEIFREDEAEWGRDDDRVLRQHIADGWPS